VVALLRAPTAGRGVVLGTVATALALLNTSYQPVVVLGLLVVVVVVLRRAGRRVVLGVLAPCVVLVAWTGAMWVETGSPTTSTWFGMNLAHVTTGAAPRSLVASLVADGTLDRTALVPAFSSLAAYHVAPVTTGPAAQAQVRRSDGQPNLNNPGYIVASRRSLRDDLAFIAAQPGRYLDTVLKGLRIWAVPGDQYYFFSNSHALGGYTAAYDRIVLLQGTRDPYLPLAILAHQAVPLDQISWTEVAMSTLAIAGAPIVGLFELRRRRRLGVAILVVWALLAQAFVISSLTEYGENNRFAFETGGLPLILATVVVATVVDAARRRGSIPRDARLEAAGFGAAVA
jgi:hypothetical protein